jgi:hypothetical protein
MDRRIAWASLLFQTSTIGRSDMLPNDFLIQLWQHG